MEWRQQTSLSCTDAFNEAQRWIEEVTGKSFDCHDFRASLENGVLLCDLINQLKPGIIKRVNRLSTPIAGLDNVSVFLKACGKLGLNESQLFHPGDLQDLSSRVTLKRDEGSRRLKNVLITIYWLGRKASQDLFYEGPQLNVKSFEGLLGLALSRALDDGNSCYNHEKDDVQRKRPSYKKYSSMDNATSPNAKATSINSEGCGSDAEAEQGFKLEMSHTSPPSNRGYLPAPLQKVRRAQEEKGCTSPLSRPGQTLNIQERPVQVNPGWIWSKSLSDIPMVYPVRKMPDETTVLGETQEPGPTHFKRKTGATKDTEAQWQDDFTKWKNRRRSSKSDVRRMSQDREHVINQMTNGANFQKPSKSGPIKRDQPSQHSPSTGAHPYAISPTKSSKSNLRPHTRALLSRSYATEMPYTTPSTSVSQAHNRGPAVEAMPAAGMDILNRDNRVASLASVGADATTPSAEFPYSSQSHVKNALGPLQPVSKNATEDNFTRSSVQSQEMSRLTAAAKGLTLVTHTDTNAIANKKSHGEKHESSMSKGQSFDKYLSRCGTWSGSASLPRGYRRSEGTSRLSSAITARPFGSKPSRVSSLPRLCNVDDSQLDWLSSNDKDETLLKRQTATIHLKGHSPQKHSEPGAGQEKENCGVLSNAIQTNGFHSQPFIQIPPQPQVCTVQVSQLKSSSSLKEPSGPVHEDHSDMRLCLTLKPNSRDDFGFQTHWDSRGARVTSIQPGSPAELCHLCINDEIIAVDGVTVSKLDSNQWKNKMSSALQTGSLTMDVRRYGNRGGSESAISDLQVPSLSPSSCSWSWDREEERRRQEKWQEEQERLLQEKYLRDQERLEAEWRKAQQDASSDNKEELKCDDSKMMSTIETHQKKHLLNGVTRNTQNEESPDGVKDKGDSPSGAKQMQQEKSGDWTKSMSTPALTSPQKQIRGSGDQRQKKGQTTVSKAEQERQQILDEMKKRTQLLTDNSWIRQRSTSFCKEPILTGVSIKRYESMDHLESWRHSPVASLTFTYPRPQSAAAGYCGSTKISSSRHSTGSMPPLQRSSAWAVTEISEEQRPESKSESKTAGPTVSPAVPNSITLPSCDQSTALCITE